MPNILIVGAGPTGLTAALELARRGIQSRVVDHKEKQSTLSRAVGINPRSLDLLEASGVTKELLAQGIPVKRADIHDRNGKIIGALRADMIPHRFNFLLALPQDKTETIMHDRLAHYGGRVEYQTHVNGVELVGNKARVKLTQQNVQREEEFDLVIAADGAHSVVRQAIGINFNGYDYPNRWSIADFESPDMPYAHNEAHLFIHGKGKVTVLIAIGEKRWRAVASVQDALPTIPGTFTVSQIITSNDFLISIRQAETYQKGCVYLAGDAAHVHSPAGGRGMNLGIDDACDLARRIVEGGLENYTAARHPVGAQVIRLSENLVRGISLTNPALVFVRNQFLALITAVPALQKPLLKSVAGLR